MKTISIALLAVMLVACGDWGSSSQPPPPPPPPPPSEGTLLSEECDGYTLVRELADGAGGSTFERTDESEECGWIPPSLTVEIDDTFGDRFKPVVIDVEYTEQGEPADWTYETDLRSSKQGNTLLVWGNGDTYEDQVLINGEPYLVQLSAEPRCEKVNVNTDCQGYRNSGRADGQIYYGEDDDQIVEWELIVLLYGGACGAPSVVRGLCDDPTDARLSGIQYRVDKYNVAMEKSGVHARFVLKGVHYVETTSLITGRRIADYLEADIAIGLGTTCPATCGCAYAYNTYNAPGFGWSVCGWQTDLHEMGHAIGLAHGPENSANQASGYLFSEFGHGWMFSQCNGSGDIMSYAPNRSRFFNSRLTCAETYDGSTDDETKVTDRSYADSAYHLNRIRYDVSLVNDEYNEGTAKSLRFIEPDEPLELILD